jgi:hypothetical protein
LATTKNARLSNSSGLSTSPRLLWNNKNTALRILGNQQPFHPATGPGADNLIEYAICFISRASQAGLSNSIASYIWLLHRRAPEYSTTSPLMSNQHQIQNATRAPLRVPREEPKNCLGLVSNDTRYLFDKKFTSREIREIETENAQIETPSDLREEGPRWVAEPNHTASGRFDHPREGVLTRPAR